MKIQYISNYTCRSIMVEGKNRKDCFNKLWDILDNNEARMDFFPAKSRIIKKGEEDFSSHDVIRTLNEDMEEILCF